MEYLECLLYRYTGALAFRVYVFWQENVDALIHTGKDIPAQKPLSFFGDRRGTSRDSHASGERCGPFATCAALPDKRPRCSR